MLNNYKFIRLTIWLHHQGVKQPLRRHPPLFSVVGVSISIHSGEPTHTSTAAPRIGRNGSAGTATFLQG